MNLRLLIAAARMPVDEGSSVVFDILRAFGRRWYVVLVGVLVTSGLVYGAYQASPPEYNARALVLLLPSQSVVGEGGNPFLSLTGLEQPAGILVAYFSSAPARAEVEALSPTAEYGVGIDDSTRGPVIAVDVTDGTPADTLMVLDHLITRIPEELALLQDQVGAPTEASIGSMVLTSDREADVDRSDTIRMMIAVLVVGVTATGVAAFAIDARSQRRAASGKSRKRVPKGNDQLVAGGHDHEEEGPLPVRSRRARGT